MCTQLPGNLQELVEAHGVAGEYWTYSTVGMGIYARRNALEIGLDPDGSAYIGTWNSIKLTDDDCYWTEENPYRRFDSGPTRGLGVVGCSDLPGIECMRSMYEGRFSAKRNADGTTQVVITGIHSGSDMQAGTEFPELEVVVSNCGTKMTLTNGVSFKNFAPEFPARLPSLKKGVRLVTS